MEEQSNELPEATLTAAPKPEAPKPATPKQAGSSSNKPIYVAFAIIIGILAVVILVFFVAGTGKAPFVPQSTPTITNTPTATPTAFAISPLDGTRVTPGREKRHALGIMIENHTEARPQSGLTSASIVYEAIAEGGITRFLAIFGPNDAKTVGPVRSARDYYIDWATEYNAFYVHCGGSPQALSRLATSYKYNLDQFYNGKYFYRAPRAGIAFEHTLFSSTEKLYQAAKDKKWPLNDLSVGKWEFRTEAFQKAQPDINKISIAYSNLKAYSCYFLYNAKTNSYDRYSGDGVAIKDANNSKNVSPKNLVLQYVNRAMVDAKHWDMTTIGSGEAKIFIGGSAIEGTWKKKDMTSRTTYYDGSGKVVVLNPGQTWVCIVNPGQAVSTVAPTAPKATATTK